MSRPAYTIRAEDMPKALYVSTLAELVRDFRIGEADTIALRTLPPGLSIEADYNGRKVYIRKIAEEARPS